MVGSAAVSGAGSADAVASGEAEGDGSALGWALGSALGSSVEALGVGPGDSEGWAAATGPTVGMDTARARMRQAV
ncbi:MAG: hypothetical protein H0U37_02425 [Chloroflexi bacterium]|nr:hypothetical protein [Chloroflexota bacterium]